MCMPQGVFATRLEAFQKNEALVKARHLKAMEARENLFQRAQKTVQELAKEPEFKQCFAKREETSRRYPGQCVGLPELFYGGRCWSIYLNKKGGLELHANGSLRNIGFLERVEGVVWLNLKKTLKTLSVPETAAKLILERLEI